MAELFDSLAGRTRFTHHFCVVFNGIFHPTAATSNVISGKFVGPAVPDKHVKFGDSREIPPEAVGGGIVDGFFAVTSDRK